MEQIVAQIDDESVPEHIDRHWVGIQMMKEHWRGELPEELRGQGTLGKLRSARNAIG